MFSSIFSASDPKATNFHPVTSKFPEESLFGKLEPKDTEWQATSSGFIAETQTFYTITDDGRSIMCQVIHSSVGLWYPTVQFTCKIYDQKTKNMIWKSTNVSNFAVAPSGLDRRSCKSDSFTVTHKEKPGADFPESYTIQANLSSDLQVFLEVSRPKDIVGYKLGSGPQGGYSYFGTDPTKADGYVIHRFWPRFQASGHVMVNGQMSEVKGPGMMVHAIQGMRPNLVATRWNFAHFQSEDLGGVSAIQMEFRTTKNHGQKGEGSGGVVVNLGSLVVGGKLACVTGETKWPDADDKPSGSVISRAQHLPPFEKDSDTGYQKPSGLLFEWAGHSLLNDSPGIFKARLQDDVGSLAAPRGLIEKVDVLAEIPYVIKKAAATLTGAKPYIYQWINPAKITITYPSGDEKEAEGTFYSEATFIS